MSVKNKFPEKVHMGKLVLQILIFARKLSIYSSTVMIVQRILEITKITTKSMDHVATSISTETS
mgnify:CR=1 FL=1